MKKKYVLLVIMCIMLVGCSSNTTNTHKEQVATNTYGLEWGDVERFIDSEAGVVCYVYTGDISTRGSISCMSIGETRLDD